MLLCFDQEQSWIIDIKKSNVLFFKFIKKFTAQWNTYFKATKSHMVTVSKRLFAY